MKRQFCIKKNRLKFGKSASYEVIPLKTGKHFYIQLNNLSTGLTLKSFSTSQIKKFKSISNAVEVAKICSKFCKDNNLNLPVLNRANIKYHGILKAFYENLKEELK